jgi:hypothetical protein
MKNASQVTGSVPRDMKSGTKVPFLHGCLKFYTEMSSWSEQSSALRTWVLQSGFTEELLLAALALPCLPSAMLYKVSQLIRSRWDFSKLLHKHLSKSADSFTHSPEHTKEDKITCGWGHLLGTS